MNTVLFFKVKEIIKGRYNVVNHYFRFKGINYLINNENLDMLKDNLEVPFIVEAYALSRAEIGRIIHLLKEDNMMININLIPKDGDQYYRYEISFKPLLDIKKYQMK